MTIRDAIEQGKLFDWKFEHLTPVELATAAMTMSAALLEIEQVCDRHTPGHPAVEQIRSIIDGEKS